MNLRNEELKAELQVTKKCLAKAWEIIQTYEKMWAEGRKVAGSDGRWDELRDVPTNLKYTHQARVVNIEKL